MNTPSQEALRRAWDFCKTEHHWDDPCYQCKSLAAALDSWKAKAVLEEAKDWLVIIEILLKGKERDLSAKRILSECRQRVADLKGAA